MVIAIEVFLLNVKPSESSSPSPLVMLNYVNSSSTDEPWPKPAGEGLSTSGEFSTANISEFTLGTRAY